MTEQNEWDPLRHLMSVQKRMNQLFESALARTDFETEQGLDSWTPVGDVYETADAIEMCIELPGLEQDKIDLRIDGDELVVEGEREMDRDRQQFHRVERSYGKFARRVRLPSTVDRESIEANYRAGLLRVTMPKRAGSENRSIRVSIAEA